MPSNKVDARLPVDKGGAAQISGVINFDSANAATGIKINRALPEGCVIDEIKVDVLTVFNAGTTNVLTLGTASDADAYVVAAGVDETALGTTKIAGPTARLTADTEVLMTYTQSGTAATTGKARFTVIYHMVDE